MCVIFNNDVMMMSSYVLTVTTSPADSSQSRINTEPYLDEREFVNCGFQMIFIAATLPEPQAKGIEHDEVQSSYSPSREHGFLDAHIASFLQLLTIPGRGCCTTDMTSINFSKNYTCTSVH